MQMAPEGSIPLFFDGSSPAFTAIPENLVQKNSQNQLIAPEGYSFIPMSMATSLPSLSPAFSSMSVSDSDLPELVPSRSASVEPMPVKEEAPKRKKFPHRSKQERIIEVHASLKEEYTARGLYAADDEVLRGPDTVRVHVKTFHGLNKIKNALDEVHKCPQVTVRRIATPFSMKNKFQRKGFIVYLKLASASEVPAVQSVFERYSEYFKRCDVALPKEKPAEPASLPPLTSALEKAGFSEKDSWDDADIFMPTPPPFERRMSHEMAA